ncbi:MAG: 2-amino-4-hydroxy-6-hydroxymethyldihydropteridine diphosphokinase [Chloroflexi bacterium]|nr:2-amino-4-hydroxy-6-hydroxymethyldihydropteridine diphosphokinase [Chloroflexota bacterium]
MSGTDTVVYLGLGANLGDRRGALTAALRGIEPAVRVDAVSSLYETAPVGPQDQLAYYNAACRGVTSMTPRALLDHVKAVERELGRSEGPRWGPREIDIDILLFGIEVVEEEGLTVPHLELANRAFVLAPLAEIAAHLLHPLLGKSIEELAAAVDQAGVRMEAGPGWQRN